MFIVFTELTYLMSDEPPYRACITNCRVMVQIDIV